MEAVSKNMEGVGRNYKIDIKEICGCELDSAASWKDAVGIFNTSGVHSLGSLLN